MNWQAKALVDSSDKLYAEVAKSHARRNCLVIGPAGSGKLSLVRGLAALSNPRARKFLFDWEVEKEAQYKLLVDLDSRIRQRSSGIEVWMHRKIHLLRDTEYAGFIRALRSLQDTPDYSVICYATSELPRNGMDHTQDLERLFTVQITLGDGGFAHGAFESILDSALSALRRKYGRAVTSIDPDAIRFLENVAMRAKMPAMLSALERAFVLETGSSVHISTLLNGAGRLRQAIE